MDDQIEALLRQDGERTSLCSPGVGYFTCALPAGRCVVGGEPAGVLITAGRAVRVVVPAGASGLVRSERPERVHCAVGYGGVLYELDPLGALETGEAEDAATDRAAGALVLPAPQTGRFWRRTSPKDAALCSEGDILESGRAVGLIEVMKTFTQIVYRPGGGLPAAARVTRFLIEDGGEVTEGDALVELEEV